MWLRVASCFRISTGVIDMPHTTDSKLIENMHVCMLLNGVLEHSEQYTALVRSLLGMQRGVPGTG